MAEIELRLTGAAGEHVQNANIVAWLKHPGESVREGESIVVVETAKGSTKIAATTGGVLARIVSAVGAEVSSGGVLAIIERSGGGWILASPIARRLARENALDLAAIAGSGPDGRIGERDVLAVLAARRQDGRREAPAGYRKAMAKRMSASAAVPQFSVSLSVDGAGIEALLDKLKAGDGTPISANDVIMKSVALALREAPRFNARWDGDAVLFHDHINLGMAVATEHGLAVPVIRDADKLSLRGIASAGFRLRRRTLGRKLTPEDVARASFTVSNLGLLGAEEFVALLNPPEVGILAVGAFTSMPVVRDGAIVVRRMAKLTVTGDHRVVDGADAARLLTAIKTLLENAPSRLASEEAP